jgi:hypothetical protein
MNKWRLRRSVETSLSGRSRSCDRCADSVLCVIRRAFALTVALGGLVSLTACSTVDKPAATVNGVEIPMSSFAKDVDALAASELGKQGVGFVDADRVGFTDGDATRQWMQLQVFGELTTQILAANGEALPADQVEATRAEFANSGGWNEFSPELQSTILNIAIGGNLYGDQIQASAAEADIDIASTIGEWDADALQVVPAGS